MDRTKLKSVAVIGPYADIVALDWYSGTPPYAVSALDGIKAKLGSGVQVKFAKDNTDDAAVKIARGRGRGNRDGGQSSDLQRGLGEVSFAERWEGGD